MRIGIDPGHGFANRSPGIFDPGAVYAGVREADVALAFGLALEGELLARGASVWMTRRDGDTPTPLIARAPGAKLAGCTVLVSLHCNAAASEAAHGTETCFRIPNGDLARRLQAAVVGSLGLRDRGIVPRDELAVLRGGVPAALIELGFLSNPGDRSALLDPKAPQRTARALADVLCSPR